MGKRAMRVDKASHHPVLGPLPVAVSGLLLRDLSAELLGGGYEVRFRAPGQSMHPVIREGDALIVRPVSPEAVRKGDIILYRWPQGVIAHRVVAVDKADGGKNRLLTRGDAAGAPVEAVTPDQVLGKVVAAERKGRRIALYGIRVKVRRLLQPLASRCKQWVLNLRKTSPEPLSM